MPSPGSSSVMKMLLRRRLSAPTSGRAAMPRVRLRC
jgi:hypothetical protein